MDRRITLVGISSLLVVGLAILLNQFYETPGTFRGTSYGEPFPKAPDFQLMNAQGDAVNLRSYQGKIVLLFFGYTYCPDVCPTTLSELKLVMDRVGDKAGQIQVIFVSVDPGRDTSKTMQKYVERFNSEFIGLSGSEDELRPIWRDYGVFREIVPGTSELNYIVNHTARVILIDQAGNLRLSYGFQTPPEDIANDILILLEG